MKQTIKITTIFFIAFSMTSFLQSMQTDFDCSKENTKQAKKQTKSIPPLTTLAARAITKNIDESNLDRRAEMIQQAFSQDTLKCPREVQDMLMLQITRSNPFPYFEKDEQQQIIDISPSLQNYIVYDVKEETFFVVDSNQGTELLSLPAKKYHDVHYESEEYVSCLSYQGEFFYLYRLDSLESSSLPPSALVIGPKKIVKGIFFPKTQCIVLALVDNSFITYRDKDKSWEEETTYLPGPNTLTALNHQYQLVDNRLKRSNNPTEVVCHAPVNIAFLNNPSSDNEEPQLLLSVSNRNTPCCSHGLLTCWNYNNKSWNYSGNLQGKHDWPVISMQLSSDAKTLLTQSAHHYLGKNFVTCWKRNRQNNWHILKKIKQRGDVYNPTFIANNFFITVSSLGVFKIFAIGETKCTKIRTFRTGPLSFSEAPNPSPYKPKSINTVYIGNHLVTTGHYTLPLTVSTSHALCQQALYSIATSEQNEKRFSERSQTLQKSKTFQHLVPQEQHRFQIYIENIKKEKDLKESLNQYAMKMTRIANKD